MRGAAAEAPLRVLQAENPGANGGAVLGSEGTGEEVQGGNDEEGKGEAAGVVCRVGRW